MIIRSETESDYHAIAQINQLAFGGDDEAQLITKIRDSEFYIPQLSLIAEIDNIIVGHILFSYIQLQGTAKLSVLGLAPLAVHPSFQRQGIGSELVKVGLTKAEEKQEALVIVLGHPHFYHRFGFEPSVNYGIESPFAVPSEFFMVKPLKQYQEHYRGKVVYPPAFEQVGSGE